MEFVLVPGFWEGPGIYSHVKSKLEAKGYKATVSPLISTGKPASKEPKSPSMYDDTAVTRKVVEDLVNQGKRVVLVGHSAGALIAASSTKDLGEKERKEAGKSGGVAKLAFITGAIFPVGHMHENPPFADVQGDEMYCQAPRQLLFNDLPDDQAEAMVKTLSCQPTSGWNNTVGYAGWMNIPSAYLVCEKDAALPPPLQEQLAGMAKCNPIEKCDAGHCAPITNPEAVAAFLVRIAGS